MINRRSMMLAFIMACAIGILIFSGMVSAKAVYADTEYYYLNKAGNAVPLPDKAKPIDSWDEATDQDDWFYVDGKVDISDRIGFDALKANLVLMDGCELNANKGITVEVYRTYYYEEFMKKQGKSVQKTLNIYVGGRSQDIEGTGKLNANASKVKGSAGIGGRSDVDHIQCGAVNIYGGDIRAIGGRGAAGIGGACTWAFSYNDGFGGDISVYDGTIYAESGDKDVGGIGPSLQALPHLGGVVYIAPHLGVYAKQFTDPPEFEWEIHGERNGNMKMVNIYDDNIISIRFRPPDPEDYGLTVGSVKVNSNNADNIFGEKGDDGEPTARFEAHRNSSGEVIGGKLIFNDAIVSKGVACIESKLPELELEGTLTLTGNGYGILTYEKDIAIVGSKTKINITSKEGIIAKNVTVENGELNIIKPDSRNECIGAMGNTVINGGKVNLEGGKIAFNGYGSLTINGGEFRASVDPEKGETAVASRKNIILGDKMQIMTPENSVVDDYDQAVYSSSTKCKTIYQVNGDDEQDRAVAKTVEIKRRTVDADTLAPGDHVYLGAKEDGYQGTPYWRVMAKKDTDGDGKDDAALLLSEYLWTGDGTDSTAALEYNYDNESMPEGSLIWEVTTAKSWCDLFYQRQFSDLDKSVIKGAELHDEGLIPDITTEDKVFFLSSEEVKQYFDTSKDIGGDADKKLIALDKKNGAAGDWWLRTNDGSENAVSVSGTGAMSWTPYGSKCALRPALYLDITSLKLRVGGIDTEGHRDFAPSWYDPMPGEYEDEQGGGDDPDKQIKIYDGTEFSINGAVMKVTSVKSGTLSYVKAPNIKTVTVYSTVKIGGKTLKVTKIASGAFKKSKATTVTIKTKSLTKKTVTGSLKGSRIKTIKVDVGTKKQNKTYAKKYKKIFTKKNCGRKVKVK